jgi:transcriptional pleiotropic regulator of transition state genes
MLYLEVKDAVEVFTESDTIVLRKYEPHCILCGSMKGMKHFKGKQICSICIEVIVTEE